MARGVQRKTLVVVLALVTFGCATTPESDPTPTSSLAVEATPPTESSSTLQQQEAPDTDSSAPGTSEAGTAEIDSQPDECSPDAPNLALGRTAYASTSLPDHDPSMAVDDDPNTFWSSGEPAVQWVEVDLGAPTAVTCIRLLVHQSAPSQTTHRVNGGVHDNPGAERGTLTLDTAEGQWLQLEGDWSFQFLRITTEDGPSPVAWYEVVVR